MENALRPQLSELRQKRLAYFEQRHPLSPPSDPKPSCRGTSTTLTLVATADKFDGYHCNTTYSRTGAIPKSYRGGQSDIHEKKGRKKGLDPVSKNLKTSSANGTEFNNRLGTGKKETTVQSSRSKEFDRIVSNDVDELFHSNLERSSVTDQALFGSKVGDRPSDTHIGVNHTASTDYEQQLSNHLKRTDRKDIMNEISGTKISDSGTMGTRGEKVNLPRFFCEEAKAPALVQAASDHSALHAESILQQMREVRKLRQQVHEELRSGFSKEEMRLRSRRGRAEGERSTTDKDVKFFCSESASLGSDVTISQKLLHSSDSANVASVSPSHTSSKIDDKPSTLLKENSSSSTNSTDSDKDAHIFTEAEVLDSDDTAFDLGALQKAAKQGDAILRKYIQSLSRNIKKKSSESTGITSQNTLITNKQTEFAGNRHVSNDTSTYMTEGLKRERLIKCDVQEKDLYTPKVSKPAITSDELESLGLFSDVHRKPTPLKADEDASVKSDEACSRSSQDEELGLQTHRPQERAMSPLQQVYVLRDDIQKSTDSCELGDDHPSQSETSSNEIETELHTHVVHQRQETKLEPFDNMPSCQKHFVSVESDNSSNLEGTSFAQSDNAKPPPRYDQLFSDQEICNVASFPFPHPLGTEVGQFVCSEQSTDSEKDTRDLKNLAGGGLALKPNPPKGKKSNSAKICRRKPRTLTPESSKRPKTPERHIDSVREYHQREREIRRRYSSHEAQNPQGVGDETCKSKLLANQQSHRFEKATLNADAKSMNGFSQYSNTSEDVLEDFFQTYQPQDNVEGFVGPSGDANSELTEPNHTAKICPDCNSFNVRNLSKCEICRANISYLPFKPVDFEVPVFDEHFKELAGGDSLRNHENLEEFDPSALGQGDCRIDEQDESTVMQKIANFVPKPTTTTKGNNKRNKVPKMHLPEFSPRGKEKTSMIRSLPERIDTWLAENETNRPSDDPNLPGEFQMSGSNDAERKVTFEFSSDGNPVNHQIRQNGCKTGNYKPQPSTSGPQRSRQSTSKSVSKSKTSQLIEKPMFHRRWPTSSSTWGSRRSVSDSLQVPSQRPGILDSTFSSRSLNTKKNRPSSAQHLTTPQKCDSDLKIRNPISRPKSAGSKSKDLDIRKGSSNLKEEFLSVNSAHIKEGHPSTALNCSHSSLPLTLKLISDSPRGCDDLSVWELLPDEILLDIFSHLSYKDLINCSATCSRFYRIASDDTLWRTIRLRKRQLSDFSLTQIGDRHPVYLSLTQCRGNVVTENGLRNLFRSCSDTLQELNISGCSGGELTGDSLLLHASRCQHLTSLDASWCQVTDNGLAAISESCHRLTSLCLNGCQSVSDDSLSKVVQKHGKSLHVLEILGCLQLSPETLHLIGRECRHLYTLNIGQCYKVTDECVGEVVVFLRSLKHLDLRGCKQIRDSCIRKIVRNCKQLETLILANCTHVTNSSIVEIATYLPTIKSLDVSGCKKINNEGIRSLATCCHNLLSLNVSSTGVDAKSVSALANYCNKTLLSLHLNCCKDITETVIIKLLKNCKRLQTLHLYGVKGLRNLTVLKLQYPSIQFE